MQTINSNGMTNPKLTSERSHNQARSKGDCTDMFYRSKDSIIVVIRELGV